MTDITHTPLEVLITEEHLRSFFVEKKEQVQSKVFDEANTILDFIYTASSSAQNIVQTNKSFSEYHLISQGIIQLGASCSDQHDDANSSSSSYHDRLQAFTSIATKLLYFVRKPNGWAGLVKYIPKEEREASVPKLMEGNIDPLLGIYIKAFADLVGLYNSHVANYTAIKAKLNQEDQGIYDSFMLALRKQICVINAMFHPSTRDDFLSRIHPTGIYRLETGYVDGLIGEKK